MQETTVDSKYKIVRLLGQGGMGAVYEARHLGTGRRVALKVIVPSALVPGCHLLARFQREARASGSIDSQHVVQVLDTGVDPATSSPYLVMEYLTGEDLQQTVQRCGPLPVDTVLRIMAQACEGLARAHEAGIIHRDIKSANLFISRRESGELSVKILDFGIAKVRADPLSGANQSITRTGALLGSPLYMSPEQVLGAKNIDARADIFSLGVTMYEALCGVTPNHHCETVGMLVIAICGGKGVPIRERQPSLPEEVAAIVDKALALDASARFQSTREMLAAITALVAQLPGGASLTPSMLPGASFAFHPPATSQALAAPTALGAPAEAAKSDGSAFFAVNTMPLLSPVPPSPSSPPDAAVPQPVATTHTAFTDTSPSLHTKHPGRIYALAAAVAIVSGGVGIGIYRLRAPVATDDTSSAQLDRVAVQGSVSSPPPSAAVTSATETAPPSEVDASVTPVTVVVPVIATASSVPVVPVVQPAFRPKPAVLQGSGANPLPASRTTCDPPYTFNADGKKIWKRECL